jgi:secreted trypsin-like serine protease
LFGLLSCPLRAIVVASGDPNSSSVVVAYDQSVDGVNLNGVVKIISDIAGNYYGCTGSLLSDGLSILTAAHCVTEPSAASSVTVYFPEQSGFVSDTVANYYVDPGWTGNSTQGNDLAILRLSQAAPSSATRYSLYTGVFTNSPILMVGYGVSGTGTTGECPWSGSSPTCNDPYGPYYPFGTLRQGQNRYDTVGTRYGWSAKMLLGDFDSGTAANDAIGFYSHDSGIANLDLDISNEVDIAHGDSGGPSFYNGQIIGVHDLIVCFSDPDNPYDCAVGPSVSTSNNSYFGQVFADTSVSGNALWIKSEEVVPEPASCSLVLLGLAIAGFLRSRTSCRPS